MNRAGEQALIKRGANWARLMPLALSALAIAFLLTHIDLSPFHGLGSRIRWEMLPLIVLNLTCLVGVLGWRWHLLSGKRSQLMAAEAANAIGLGANQVLPARGGDLLKVLIGARIGIGGIGAGLSALIMEKMLDLLAAGLLGACVLSLATSIRSDSVSWRLAMAGSIILLALVICVAILVRSGIALVALRSIARVARLPPRIYRKAARLLVLIRYALGRNTLRQPLLMTGLLWPTLYTLVFYLVPRFVGVDLGWAEAGVLLFTGALGLAVPSAPSGLGMFHAGVVSGFLIIGRDPSEGLLVATVIHSMFFVFYGLVAGSGLLLLPFLKTHRGNAVSETRT